MLQKHDTMQQLAAKFGGEKKHRRYFVQLGVVGLLLPRKPPFFLERAQAASHISVNGLVDEATQQVFRRCHTILIRPIQSFRPLKHKFHHI